VGFGRRGVLLCKNIDRWTRTICFVEIEFHFSSFLDKKIRYAQSG
jgi:hypothetical protein